MHVRTNRFWILGLLLLSWPGWTYAAAGSGSASISPLTDVPAGAQGVWTITYQAAESFNDGLIRFTIPAGWTPPQNTTTSSAGYITTSSDHAGATLTVSVNGQVVDVDIDNLAVPKIVTLVYGDTTGGNPGALAQAPTTPQSAVEFLVESTPDTSISPPIPLASGSPTLDVVPGPVDELVYLSGPFVFESTKEAGPFTVEARDEFGNPSPVSSNQQIDLSTTSTGGWFSGTSGGAAVGDVMMAQNTSSATFYYRDTDVGTPNVTADGNSQPWTPAVQQQTVMPGPAANLTISPTDTTVSAGDFMRYTVAVVDSNGNPAPLPESRSFLLSSAPSGQFFLPTDHGTPISSIMVSDTEDSFFVDYRNTDSNDGDTHLVIVLSNDGKAPSLSVSTEVTVLPGVADLAVSTISADSPIVADGTTPSTVTVTVTDMYGNPLADSTVTLGSTGGASVSVTDPAGPTDSNGQAVGTVTNTDAEVVTVSANVGGNPLVDTALVSFIAGGVNADSSIVTASTPVDADGTSSSTITVTARDAEGNLVSGASVTLSIDPPGNGAVLDQPGGVTDGSGQAQGALRSTTTGPRVVHATIDAVAITDSAIVDFEAGAATTFILTHDGNAVAGAFEDLTLEVQDVLGNRVLDYTGLVTLNTTSAGIPDSVVEWGVGAGANGVLNNTSGDQATYSFDLSDNGLVALRIKDNLKEDIELSANDGSASGTSATLSVDHAAADQLVLVSGDGQNAEVGQDVSNDLVVRVEDAFGNPVDGETVTFFVIGGGGTVGADSASATNGAGEKTLTQWTLGTVSGSNTIRARMTTAPGPRVEFTATGDPGTGASIDLTPTSKSVTVGSATVVTAVLRDQHLNVVPDERVDIIISDIADGSLEVNPGDPNPTTTINATARFGTTDPTGQITVVYRAANGAGLSDNVDAFTSVVGAGSVTDAVYTSVASGATDLRIVFAGSDSAQAGSSFSFTVQAVDGGDNVDTGNTSVVDLSASGGGIQFSENDFGPVVTQVTLVNGEKTIYGQGQNVGVWTLTASDNASILGAGNDDVTILDSGVVDHYVVTTVSAADAGEVFNVTIVAEDAFNNPVLGANNGITLVAVDASNTTIVLPDPLLVGNATLVAGQVMVAESYAKAGDIRIRARDGSSNEGFSNAITISPGPAYRLVEVSGDSTGVVAGAGVPLSARVVDANDNPVSGETVVFSVLEGGGNVAPPSPASDVNGLVNVTFTTGVAAGQNRAKGTIGDGDPAGLETVEFVVQTGASNISYYTIVPTKFSLVAGEVTAVEVTAFDSNDNIVSDDNTTIVDLGSDTGNAVYAAASGMLSGGVFATTVFDTVAENVDLTVQTQGGGPSGVSATVTVSNDVAHEVLKIGGDASGLVVGAVQYLEVEVRDQYSNLVQGQPVSFAILGSPDGTAFLRDSFADSTDGIVSTDGSGQANVRLHTAGMSGDNVVRANILDGTPPALETKTFTVSTVAGAIDYYEVTAGTTQETAGVPVTIKVKAFDSNDNLVDDSSTNVLMTMETGSATFSVNPVTLAAGSLMTDVTSTAATPIQVRATTDGGSATGLGPVIQIVPDLPAGSIIGAAVPDTLTADGVSLSTVTTNPILDQFGNSVPLGTLVDVSTDLGTIASPDQEPGSPSTNEQPTDGSGVLSFLVRAGTTPGTATVTMFSDEGVANGNTTIEYVPPPQFVCTNPPVPGSILPGVSVAFKVFVQNSSTTDVTLATGTTFEFTDGVNSFSAALSTPQFFAASSSDTLYFASTMVNSAMATGSYQPIVNLIGTDQHGAPFAQTCFLPASSLKVSTIEIVSITANPLVSRGSTENVIVGVKNLGTADVTIQTVNLNIPSGTYVFNPSPDLPAVISFDQTEFITIPVTIQPASPLVTSTIDASVSGVVSGFPVFDNTFTPNPLPQWTIQSAADIVYTAGTLVEDVVSLNQTHSFSVTLENQGGATVTLDGDSTRLSFDDGSTFVTTPLGQSIAIAGSASRAVQFDPVLIPGGFTPGVYNVTLHLEGLESGAPFESDLNTGDVGDQLNVQTPANVSYDGGSLTPTLVTRNTTAFFEVDVSNAGGAQIELDGDSTRFFFSGGAYDAGLDENFNATITTGLSTLRFSPELINPTSGSYAPTVRIVGTENGIPFAANFPVTDNVQVQDAPDVSIVSVVPSQTEITADQAAPFELVMTVTNAGQAAVSLDSARVRFILGGVDRTTQFAIVNPGAFDGGSTLPGGQADDLRFNVSDNILNQMNSGTFTIEGNVWVEDVVSTQKIEANTNLGGKGSLTVQTETELAILSIIPTRDPVTAGRNTSFQIKMAVQNNGQSEAKVFFDTDSTDIAFSLGNDWVWTGQPTFTSGDSILSASEVDTAVFDVTTVGSVSGSIQITGTVKGLELNSGRIDEDGTGGGGSGNILVQTQADIQVTSIVPSRSTVTQQSQADWSVVVHLQNNGESDIDLNLPGSVSLTFTNETIASQYQSSSTLLSGATVLAGGAADSLLISVDSTGAVSTPGSNQFTVALDGTEVNSGVTVGDAGLGSISMQLPPVASYVSASLDPDTVSTGAVVEFFVDLSNTEFDGSTLELDPAQTRLRFGGGLYNVTLDLISPTTIAGGQTQTLQFNTDLIDPSIPLGDQAVQLILVGQENGNNFNEQINLPAGQLIVQAAPQLSIKEIRPSQPKVTQGQTQNWDITMVVENNGQAGVDLDLASTATKIQFVSPGTGDVTGQYTVLQPSGLEFAGGTVLPGGAEDSLKFTVQATGSTLGPILLNGAVEGVDLNSLQNVSDDTFDGGSGSVDVQSPGALQVVSITPSQSTVTAAQSQQWTAKMAVSNTGGSTLDIQAGVAVLEFAPSAGWTYTPPTQLEGGGTLLDPGVTDSLFFTITATAGAGNYQMGGKVSGVETNSSVVRSDTTDTSGTGAITVQTPADPILNITTSRPTVSAGTTLDWFVYIEVVNQGQSAMQVDFAGPNTGIDFPNAVNPFTKIDPVLFEEGGDVVPGNESRTMKFTIAATDTVTPFGPTPIHTAIDYIELNSNRIVEKVGTGSVIVQRRPNISYDISTLEPDTVSSGASVAIQLSLTNNSGPGATATLKLDPAQTRLRFGSSAFDVTLDPILTDSLTGGNSTIVRFNAAVVDTSIPAGPQTVEIDIFGEDNGNPFTQPPIVLPLGELVVQDAPQLSINAIKTSQAKVTTGQTQPWTVTMVLENNGQANVDLDLSPAATNLQFVSVGLGDISGEYTITTPTALEFNGGTILPGGETDSIKYTVQVTGVTTGAILINGRVTGEDQNSSQTVTDNTFDGGSGNVLVQTPGILEITSIDPSQPTATVNQTQVWSAAMRIKNVGGSEILLATDADSSFISFDLGSGWATTLQSTNLTIQLAAAGPIVLGENDTTSVFFDVVQTGDTPGTVQIHGRIRGTQLNDSDAVTDTTDSSGWGVVQVQTPASLNIQQISKSLEPVTKGQTQPWQVFVQVKNDGDADAVLSFLDDDTYLVFPTATPADTVTQPQGIASIPGDSTRTLTFTVAPTPNFAGFGNEPLDVTVAGIELNTNNTVSTSAGDNVVVQIPPDPTYVGGSLIPGALSRGSNVVFEVEVQEIIGAADVALDPNETRFIFSDGVNEVRPRLNALIEDSIAAGTQTRLVFENVFVDTFFQSGTYEGRVRLQGTENGNFFSKEFVTGTDSITINEPSQINIVQVAVSQNAVTASQARDWTAKMVLQNNGDFPVRVEPSGTSLDLSIFGGGNVTSEYTINSSYLLEKAGNDILTAGETDTITFVIDVTGATTGQLTVHGIFEGEDVPSMTPVFDNTFDGGSAAMVVQSPADLQITQIRTSQPTVTRGQTTPWQAIVYVMNTGEASTDVTFSGATPDIRSIPAALFNWTPPTALDGGGTTLSGGQVDSLIFTATSTGSTTGTAILHAAVLGNDSNSGDATAFDTETDASGSGSIVVQDSARVIIRSIAIDAANSPNVNINQNFGVIVEIANEGEADADSVTYLTTSINGSVVQAPTSHVVVTIPAGQSVLDTFTVQARPTPGPDNLTTSITRVLDANSQDPSLVSVGPDASAPVQAQAPANLLVDLVTPSQATVTRQQTQPWFVDVRVGNSGEASLQITQPTAGDLTFTTGGPPLLDYVVLAPDSFLSGDNSLILLNGATETLRYTVATTGNDTGLVQINASIDAVDINDLSLHNASKDSSVTVQSPSGLFIQSTSVDIATAPNNPQPNLAFVNSGQLFNVEVTVQNSGEDLDSVMVNLVNGTSQINLVSPSFVSIAQASSATFVFEVMDTLLPAENSRQIILSASITKAISVNSGEEVTPRPPVDPQEFITIERPADLLVSLLITAPAAATDGTVSTNQPFQLTGLVRNEGVASVEASGGELTLSLPSGFSFLPSTPDSSVGFTVGTPVVWDVMAPTVVVANQMLTSTITVIPNDRNVGAPAAVTQADSTVIVNVFESASFNSPTISIISPAGATDSILSTDQTFVARATVVAEQTMANIVATILLPPGSTLIPDPATETQNLGDGDGGIKTVFFNVDAPSLAAIDSFTVRFNGEDENSGERDTLTTMALPVQIVPKTELTLSAAIVSPEAQDNIVSIGAPFTIKAVVENALGNAGVDTTTFKPRISMTLPQGYTFAASSPPATQGFAIGDSVSWTIRAPDSISGPKNLAINVDNAPADENSMLQISQVINNPTLIPMQTSASTVTVRNISGSLGFNTKVVPRGTSDVGMLGIRITNPPTPSDSVRIEWIDVSLLDKNQNPIANPGQVISELYALVGGTRVDGIISQNPIRVPVQNAGNPAFVGPNNSQTLAFYVSVAQNASAAELRIEIADTSRMFIRDVPSGQRLPVIDEETLQDFTGKLKSERLVILSNQFSEYTHNYPNPFRAGSESTRIAYFMDSQSSVSIKIYSLSGNLVYERSYSAGAPETQTGPQEVLWDGRNMKSEVVRNGLYVCRVEAGSNSATFKIAVAK